MEITFKRLVISKRLVDDVNTVMQLHDDMKRELQMDFILRILRNVMQLSLGAGFPEHLHMRHPITDMGLQVDTYTRAFKKTTI